MELTREIRDKRKAIAADVIANVTSGDYDMAVHNGYIVRRRNPATDRYFSEPPALDLGRDMQGNVDHIAATCSVCNMGAYLLSKARLYDGVPIRTLTYGDGSWCSPSQYEVREQLRDIFDRTTLVMIECAFEGHSGSTEIVHKAYRFGLAAGEKGETLHDIANLRAIAVAQNIINNDGEFIP